MKPIVTMRHALEDPDLFGRILPGRSWASWRVLLIALMGEPLTDAERETFEALTGREKEPLERVDEFWAIIGRRGGKTRAIAVLAAYSERLGRLERCAGARRTGQPADHGASDVAGFQRSSIFEGHIRERRGLQRACRKRDERHNRALDES